MFWLINSAAVNIRLHVSIQIIVFSRYIAPRVAESYGRSF